MQLPYIEPYKIKMVESIQQSTPEQRKKWIEEASYNLFKLKSNQVVIDLITDSGTGAMSDKQWAEIMLGDESYAGSSSFLKLKKTVKGFVGIASAPDFTKEIMWKNFSKKTKSIIKSGKIYFMPSSYGNPYPISKRLIFDRSKHLVLNKKIKCNFPVRLFHGLKDTVVDVNFSIRLTKTLLSNDTIITFQKNGDHSLSQTEDLKKIKNQLTNLIKDSC